MIDLFIVFLGLILQSALRTARPGLRGASALSDEQVVGESTPSIPIVQLKYVQSVQRHEHKDPWSGISAM